MNDKQAESRETTQVAIARFLCNKSQVQDIRDKLNSTYRIIEIREINKNRRLVIISKNETNQND